MMDADWIALFVKLFNLDEENSSPTRISILRLIL